MSAKQSKKKAVKPEPTPAASPAIEPAAALASAIPVPASGAAATPAAEATAWIDSSDPRKRMLGKLALAAVWIYVAALWLLALDQTFGWGIFGPKVPPVP